MACFIVAEAGVNHNGSLESALRLVDAAADAGADAVKFQTFSADRLVSASAPKAEYQARETGGGSQHAMLKALELSPSDHVALGTRCAERGIEFMSTPFDEEAADFLVSIGMRRIKVPSGELTNPRLLRHVARFDVPLIVSTGMADLAEVQEAVAWIEDARRGAGAVAALADRVTLLHCTSNYPATPADVNLTAMRSMATATRLPVGYSDHTSGIEVALAAVALGACVIEKHFTLDRSLPGPDHRASLEPAELAKMVSGIRAVEAALGDGVKRPQASELAVRDVARRSVILAADRPAGHVLRRDDLALLRPGNGIPPKSLDAVVGRRLARAVGAGSALQWDDLA